MMVLTHGPLRDIGYGPLWAFNMARCGTSGLSYYSFYYS